MRTLTLEQLKTLHRDDIKRFSSYRDTKPEDLARLSYGDLTQFNGEPEPTDFYMPRLLSGSDYVNGSVTVSNHRVFLDEHKNVDGVFDVYGGYGTYAVAIRLDAITEEMLETFAALEEYPLISEEDHSEVEMEAENEAWKSWARDDFKRALVEKFPQLEETIDSLPEEGNMTVEDSKPSLWELLYKAMERANEYWIHETGNSAFVHLDRVLDRITEEDITRPYGDTSLSGNLPFDGSQR